MDASISYFSKKNELIVKINKNPKIENKSFAPLKLG
jgi:hypothetical protein